jgi:hypothetical protein
VNQPRTLTTLGTVSQSIGHDSSVNALDESHEGGKEAKLDPVPEDTEVFVGPETLS